MLESDERVITSIYLFFNISDFCENVKLILLDSSSLDLLRKNIVLHVSFVVDLSMDLSCKSEFNAYLFVYC